MKISHDTKVNRVTMNKSKSLRKWIISGFPYCLEIDCDLERENINKCTVMIFDDKKMDFGEHLQKFNIKLPEVWLWIFAVARFILVDPSFIDGYMSVVCT